RGKPVEQNRQTRTVSRTEPGKVDLQPLRRIRGVEHGKPCQARTAGAREGQGSGGRKAPVRRRGQAEGAGGRQAHLVCCLPIDSGFSPDSRRLITESMPWLAICGPKSSR